MPDQGEQVSLEDMPMELPPPIQQFLGKLKADNKYLLTENAFKDPEQLRAYIGTFLYPRLKEAIEMLAAASFDTYSLAVSNANGLQRLHSWTVHQFQNVGADLDEDAPLPGVSPDVMDDFQQAFYALGVLLNKKLTDDKEAQSAFNRCAELLGEMTAELMGDGQYDDDRDDDDRDDDDRDDDDRDDDDPDDASEDDAPNEPEPDADEEASSEEASSEEVPEDESKADATEEPPSESAPKED